MKRLLIFSAICGTACISSAKIPPPSTPAMPAIVAQFEKWSGMKLDQTVTIAVVEPPEVPKHEQAPCLDTELIWRAFDLLPSEIPWSKSGLSTLLQDSRSAVVSNNRIEIRIAKGLNAELATLEQLWEIVLTERLASRTTVTDECWAREAVRRGAVAVLGLASYARIFHQWKEQETVGRVTDLVRTLGSRGTQEAFGDPNNSLAVQRLLAFYAADGVLFAGAIYNAGGLPAVLRVLERPPVSSSQIIHPDAYARDELPVIVTLPSPGDDWHSLRTGSLGEIGIQMLMASCLVLRNGEHPGDGWRGDAFAIFENDDRRRSLVWNTAWATIADAEKFATHMTRRALCWDSTDATHEAEGFLHRSSVERRNQQVIVTRGISKSSLVWPN